MLDAAEARTAAMSEFGKRGGDWAFSRLAMVHVAREVDATRLGDETRAMVPGVVVGPVDATRHSSFAVTCRLLRSG